MHNPKTKLFVKMPYRIFDDPRYESMVLNVEKRDVAKVNSMLLFLFDEFDRKKESMQNGGITFNLRKFSSQTGVRSDLIVKLLALFCEHFDAKHTNNCIRSEIVVHLSAPMLLILHGLDYTDKSILDHTRSTSSSRVKGESTTTIQTSVPEEAFEPYCENIVRIWNEYAKKDDNPSRVVTKLSPLGVQSLRKLHPLISSEYFQQALDKVYESKFLLGQTDHPVYGRFILDFNRLIGNAGFIDKMATDVYDSAQFNASKPESSGNGAFGFSEY